MSKHPDGDHYLRQSLTRDYPLIVRGKGHYLWDDAGKRYFDGASGGVGAVLIGHAVPEVIEAMVKQAERLCHAHISAFNTPRPFVWPSGSSATLPPRGCPMSTLCPRGHSPRNWRSSWPAATT